MNQDLQYIVGYQVESVVVPEQPAPYAWAIVLQGGVEIRCLDENIPPPEPEGIENTGIGEVVISDDSGEVALFAGDPAEETLSVVLPETGYVIEWPEGLEPNTPVVQDTEGTRPVDPSYERVVGGPSNE
jgi:hypothetical protein